MVVVALVDVDVAIVFRDKLVDASRSGQIPASEMAVTALQFAYLSRNARFSPLKARLC